MNATSAATEILTGADVVAALLAEAGVSQTYGISGQRILPLWHALDALGIGITLTRHEQGAAYMADAHARTTEGIGVAMATSGPGAINLLGGAAAAWMDSVPLLLITAQAETTEFGKYGIQEGTGRGRTPDIQAMFDATTKKSWQPMSPEELEPAIRSAIRLALAGRPGPVHVDVPSDLFTAPIPITSRSADRALSGLRPTTVLAPRSTDIDAAVERIAKSRRPLILAGGGIGSCKTARELTTLAETLNVPIAGTFAAKRYLDEQHPLVLGPVGIYGRTAANYALHSEADLVIALGVTFSWLTTSGWNLPLPPERLVRVDIDRRELANNYQASLAINAEAGSFVSALAAASQPILGIGGGQSRCDELQRTLPDDELSGWSAKPGLLHPIQLCQAINEHLDEKTTVVADIGQNAYWVERYLRSRGGNRFVLNAGLGAMGHAVAGGIGAWRARTDLHGLGERVLVTTGDGGFLMSGMEVSSAVAENAAVTWVIFNNGTLGTQRAWFDREGHRAVAVDLPETDFVGLAQALGARGRRVTAVDELHDALSWALSGPAAGPVVIDVVIDPAPAPAGFAGLAGEA